MDPIQDVFSKGLDTRLRGLQDRLPRGLDLEPTREGGAEGPSFAEALGDNLREVVDLQNEADAKAKGLVTGETRNLHEVLLASEKAGVAFNLMLEVRNKLINAWREVTRIQV
ncbi:MAG: flagellar hook-basal body complex protein FliE [Planctomycetota bacterium]